jgi:hypothetical protein
VRDWSILAWRAPHPRIKSIDSTDVAQVPQQPNGSRSLEAVGRTVADRFSHGTAADGTAHNGG